MGSIVNNEEKWVTDIKEASEKYEIKTTSQDILRAYAERQEQPKKKKRGFPLFPSLALVGACCCCAVFALFAFPALTRPDENPKVIHPQENVRGGTRSQTAFQIFSSLNLAENFSASSAKMRRAYRIGESDFREICETFDTSYSTLNQLLTDGIDVQNQIEEGHFTGNYGNYKYRMTIYASDREYSFLNDVSFEEEDDDEIEVEYKGEIYFGKDDSWKVSLHREQETDDDEMEIEMEIDLSDERKIVIEQEIENDQREYVYSCYRNGERFYEEKIAIEKESDSVSECEMEIRKNDREYQFGNIVKEADGSVVSSYQHLDFEGTLCLNVDEKNRVYTDVETGIRIAL